MWAGFTRRITENGDSVVFQPLQSSQDKNNGGLIVQSVHQRCSTILLMNVTTICPFHLSRCSNYRTFTTLLHAGEKSMSVPGVLTLSTVFLVCYLTVHVYTISACWGKDGVINATGPEACQTARPVTYRVVHGTSCYVFLCFTQPRNPALLC